MQVIRTTSSRLTEEVRERSAFGSVFSDHILVADYTDGAWGEPRILPYQPLPLPPAPAAVHYGQAAFEGLRAHRTVDGGVALFRVEENARRMNRSMARLSMPDVPRELFVEGIRALVALDREWVPRGEGGALYIRPVCFATEECLQVRAARSYRFVVVTAPVGTYFSGAIRLLVEERYVRACVGGTGEVKPAGNYAGTLVASMEAQERGYHNVLWLDAREQRFVEEGGVMNLVFVIDDALVTPPLTGTILPGVTRDTLLTLAREAGVRVKERPIAIDEFVRLYREGRVREAAGVGTAATIAPVSAIGYKGEDLLLPLTEDSLLMKMRDTIHDIRTGRVPDSHGWLMHVEEVPA